jgi:RNA polymerase II subunit A-like phosphatase
MEVSQPITVSYEKYPVKIISWKVKQGDHVFKDQLLGIFEYLDSDREIPKNMKQEIRSHYNGIVMSLASKGAFVNQQTYSLGTIKEPCSHAVQLHGLCALCGATLDDDYTGNDRYMIVNLSDRATINITHDALGVTISKTEAARIENERTKALLKGRKLTLLLDLDQTVIHATVDNTVGSWVLFFLLKLNNPNNPNYPLLNNVYSFTLPEKDHNIAYYIKVYFFLKY